MVIDFSSLIYTLIALYAFGGILIAAILGFGIWAVEKSLNRRCEEIQRLEEKQKRISPRFAKTMAKAAT